MVHHLTLAGAEPLTEGTQRWVYAHPHDPTKLIKVLRPLALTKGRSKLATMTEKYIPAIRSRWARKEYQEYLRLMLGPSGGDLHPPISHMYGFVQTDKGLGCMTDAVMDGGKLGKTLKDKAEDLDTDDLALFNDTIRRLYLYDIRAGDMTARNFVFGQRAINGTPGPRECVLVDGFGDIHAIPIRSAGRWFNRYGLDDSCKRLARKTGLRWDPQTRQFSQKQGG